MADDVAKIFGCEGDAEGRYFSIGNPLDMDTQVCLDMIRFAERSNGIFGKTGTGKSFLTRLALCGLIHYDKAVNLIFDMHNEYGFKAMKENGSSTTFVKGLKQLFGERVAIFSLDPQSTRARGVQPDHEVYISYDQITVEDIAPLQDELKLNPTAVESAYLVYAIYKERWLSTLLKLEGPDVEEFAREIGAHAGSLVALHRKLKRLENFPFMVSKLRDGDVVDRIMEYLDKGINVVLEFGQQTSMLCYLLVANIIARRIHEMYVKKSERFYATQRPEDQPRQLMITIEEAHKFLNPMAAKQTIFGTIAREMRKYYVSLLVVDQRPSSIDDEVLSQIGTRITALLNDEKGHSSGAHRRQRHRRAAQRAGQPRFQAAGPDHRPRRAHAGGDQDPRLRRPVLQRDGLYGRLASRGAAGKGGAGCGGVVWGVERSLLEQQRPDGGNPTGQDDAERPVKFGVHFLAQFRKSVCAFLGVVGWFGRRFFWSKVSNRASIFWSKDLKSGIDFLVSAVESLIPFLI